MTDEKLGTRMKVMVGVVAFMFAALGTRLWFLQVLAAEQYREQAQSNRVRLVPLPAARGQILDRNGNVLVENEAVVEIVVNRRAVPDEESLLYKLSELLDVPVRTLSERLTDPTFLPFQRVPVAQGVPERIAAYIAEHRSEFPGVDFRELDVRKHPFRKMAAHALGYLGQITEEELNRRRFAGYRPGDLVGRGGVEQEYDRFLRGKTGWLKLEVDSRGKVLDVLGQTDPEPGNDLVTTLDVGLQQLTEESLEQGVEAAHGLVGSDGYLLRAPAGAAVVLDPRNGEIRAMASYPSFDPRIFQDRLTEKEWRRLTKEGGNHPLSNRVIQGTYPAASTIKPFVAAAAVRAGLAQPDGAFPCPPTFQVPGDQTTVFNNWTDKHFGYLSLADSLAWSCDTVYYQFGFRFYQELEQRGEMMQQLLRRFGLGKPTGVDLPAESQGRVPDESWKEAVHEAAPKLYPQPIWLPGDNINMSIGQGDLLVTPLQLAVGYGALANGGTMWRPHVGLQVQSPDGDVVHVVERRRLGRVPGARAFPAIEQGLKGAVQFGTADQPFRGWPHERIPVAGKTGTAEVTGKQNHSWFVGWAPADEPKYVVAVVVEEGGAGSAVAAPIVRRILEGGLGLTKTELKIGAEVSD